jgi:hypothetical protein
MSAPQAPGRGSSRASTRHILEVEFDVTRSKEIPIAISTRHRYAVLQFLHSLCDAPRMLALNMRGFCDKAIFLQPSASRWAAAFLETIPTHRRDDD